MSTFDLYGLPEELVLDIAELLGVAELTAFIRTSTKSWRIASRLLASFSIEDMEQAFQDAAVNDQPAVTLRLLPLIRRAGRDIRWYAIEALACACRANDLEGIQTLLGQGVPYNPSLGRDYRHKYWKVGSPLLCAMKSTEPGALLALLDAGADINAVIRRAPSEPLLHHAASEGYPALVNNLIFPDSNLDVNQREQAIRLAAKRGHYYIVALLLAQNADLYATDDRGRTPLSWAAAGGHVDIINLLLDHGAPLESTDKYGYTALLIAITKRSTKAVKALLQRGANVNHLSSLGRSALSIAAGLCMNKGLIATTLVAHGAVVDQVDIQGRTPLSYAYENHALKAVDILLRAGADATRLDNSGRGVKAYYKPGYGFATMKYLDEENETRGLGLYLPPDPIHPDLRMNIPPEEGELEDWSDVEWILGPE